MRIRADLFQRTPGGSLTQTAGDWFGSFRSGMAAVTTGKPRYRVT
jgi:hypothetical protein